MAVWGWGQLVIRVHKDFGPPAPEAVVRHIALHDLYGPPEIHRNHGVFYVFFGRFDHQQMTEKLGCHRRWWATRCLTRSRMVS